jgi:hypothetical protein
MKPEGSQNKFGLKYFRLVSYFPVLKEEQQMTET